MAGKTGNSLIRLEAVAIGAGSSRLSKAIFAMLCLLPCLSAVLFGAVDNVIWVLVTIIAAMTFLLWLAEEWNSGGFLIDTDPMQLSLMGLIMIGCIQLAPFGGGPLSLEPYATRFFVARLVVYLVFFAACLVFINTEQRIKKAVLLVIIFGSIMAFAGILQRIANTNGIYGLRATPQSIPFGPFVNQHHFAAFMEMTGGLAIALLIGSKAGRDKRLLLAIAIVLMSTSIVLTSSRGGLLGFAGVIALAFVLNKIGGGKATTSQPRRKLILAVTGLAFVLVTFGVVLFIGGNESLFRGVSFASAQTDISSGRSHIWPIAVKIFLSHPVVGVGFDAFGVAFTRYDTWNGTFRVEQAHNDYLQTLADAGVLGFICVASYIWFLFKRGFAVITGIGSEFRRCAAIGSLAGCFGILIHSFFDFPLRTPSNTFFFLLLSAVATVTARPDSNGR